MKDKILQFFSVFYTLCGYGMFVYGLFTLNTDWMSVGLLSMILGELIDIPKN